MLILFGSFTASLSESAGDLMGGGANPGLVTEGEGLLDVELEVDAGGDTRDGDLIGGEVGDGIEPAGGCGFSCSCSR